MRLDPFNKANCIAMLNTLYPPTTATPPTRQLTAAILASQRNAFFRYITAVEKNGKSILSNLENQGARKGDANGWAVVRDIVDKYLRTANGVIEECMDVAGPEYFEADAEAFRRNQRRADSGVSFATGDRPSTSGSISSGSKMNPPTPSKPLPKSPQFPPISLPHAQTAPPCPPPLKKRGTTLERIAREFRNLRNRNDVKEMPGRETSFSSEKSNNNNNATAATKEPSLSKSRSLRKMKSTTSIREHHQKPATHSRSNSENEPMPDFDFDAKRRQMILSKQLEKEKEQQQRNVQGVGADQGPSQGQMAVNDGSSRSLALEC